MQPSPPIHYLAACAGIEVFAAAFRTARASSPLVGICFCAHAHTLDTGCILRPDSQSFLRAGAFSMRTKSAFFAVPSSLPPFPPLQGDRPHGHKGAVVTSKMMGPPSGGRLPRCLATPRSSGFFRIIFRGQTDKSARQLSAAGAAPAGDVSRKFYGASPRGGQDVR